MYDMNIREDHFKSMSAVDAATPAEDVFVELFAETFGLARVLINEYPFQDIYEQSRYLRESIPERWYTFFSVPEKRGTSMGASIEK